MADSTSQKIIRYTADTSDIEKNIQHIQDINQKMAKTLGSAYGQMAKIIQAEVKKIGNVQLIDTQGGQESIKVMKQLETIVQTTTGRFVKISETISATDKEYTKHAANVSDVTQQYEKLQASQNKLIGKASNLATNFTQLSDVNQKFSKDLVNTGNASYIIDQNFNKSSNGVQQFGYLVATSNGQILQLNETIKRTPDGLQNVSRSVSDVTDQFHKYSPGVKEAEIRTVSLGENIARLVKRAALTIPVWFAIRGSISALSSTIRDGISAIVEQDKALQKAKLNIQGTADSVSANFNILQKSALDLSLKTGKSVETIVNSFQKFATVGFDFETSLQGANGAVKLSTLLFGDATEEANAFARSMRVLVDRSDSTASAGQQIQEAMALTAELWKTNAFEINEFTNDLEKFAGTAKTTNITTQETISLLATLSTAGLRNRGGQLLRTSIQKLLENLDKLAGTLGVRVNPQLDTTFGVLFKVITELDRLQQTTGSLGPATQAIADIFGGVRGGETIRALISLRGELQKNISVLPDLKKFNNEFEEQNKQINRLVEQFHNANREIGKAFVVGITGGDDFRNSLEKIVNRLREIQKEAESMGVVLKASFDLGALTKGQPFIIRLFDDATKKGIEQASKTVEGQFSIIFEKINKSFRPGVLSVKELKDLLIEITTVGAKRLKLDEGTYDRLVQQLQSQISILDITKQINEEKTKENDIVVDLSKQQDIAKLLLADELARLRTQGALNSEVLQATDVLSKKLGIEEQSIDVLERQLEKEKAINEEKRLQSKLGSDSIKLFKIAQEQGVDIARQIGEVLAGDVDFESFVRKGNKAAEVFKTQFSDLFESKQAEQFFKGEQISTLSKKSTSGFDFNIFQTDKSKTSLEKLRGGYSIPIQEEGIRGLPEQRFSDATVRFAEAVNTFKQIELAKVNKPVTQLINNSDQLNSIKLQELQKAQANKNLINYSNNIGNVTNLDSNKPATSQSVHINGLTVTIPSNVSANDVQKLINQTFLNIGTPGTSENKTLQRALFGTNQTI